MRINSRAVSPIIATVLIILVTISAGAILTKIVVPFVKNNLQDSTECYPYQDYFKFEDLQESNCISGNNAYVSINAKNIERNVNAETIDSLNSSIEGFELIFSGDGKTKSMTVAPGVTGQIRMFDSSAINVPSPGSTRTYTASGIDLTFDKVDVLPRLKSGKLCPVSNTLKITRC